MADLKMMLQNLRDKSKCCKKDDFTGERYTIIHDMSIETLNMICEDGIEQLENAQTVNRWIPCSEKFPVDGKEVLVYVKGDFDNSIPFITTAYMNQDCDCPCDYDGELIDGEITHWMPLPGPPEGGADDAT